jgi:hypothetical protein
VVQYHRVARVNSVGSGKKLDTIFDGISLKDNIATKQSENIIQLALPNVFFTVSRNTIV